MRKIDLQQQAVRLIRQLSTEKLNSAIDYLVYLQDAEARNVSSDHEVPSQDLGTAIHEIFKQFGGWNLRYPHGSQCENPHALINNMPSIVVLDTNVISELMCDNPNQAVIHSWNRFVLENNKYANPTKNTLGRTF